MGTHRDKLPGMKLFVYYDDKLHLSGNMFHLLNLSECRRHHLTFLIYCTVNVAIHHVSNEVTGVEVNHI